MEPELIPFWNVAGTLGLANGFRAARTLMSRFVLQIWLQVIPRYDLP
jgi:hypothetical protein